MATVEERVKNAEEQTNLNPTEGQKVGGNYKKGKVLIKGFKISIENPVGSIRSGVSKDGDTWSNKMGYSYGYFNGTIGKDGDPIDVYLGPLVNKDFQVYIIDQLDEDTKSFDEHKVMFGFKDAESSRKAYLSSFNEGWKGFGNITPISLSKFSIWLKNKEEIKRPASRMKRASKIDFRNSTKSDKIKVIELDGEILEGETLLDLQDQAGNLDTFDTLVVEIASPGGSVSEGLYIMVWLDTLSQQGKNIITVVTANAYSIASLIMLAADYRIISRHGKVMVHNPMVPELKYVNANELEKYTTELRSLEKVMYELYQIFTGLSPEKIKSLMDNETYLSPEEAVQNGFADIVVDIKPKPYNMADNNTKKINMSNTLNILHRVIGMVNQTAVVNQLYYDKEGGEIEIYQADPSSYQVGDRTSIEKGEVQLSDGSIITVEDSTVKSINKAVTPDETIEDPLEPAAEFNEGQAPEEPVVAPIVEDVVEPVVEAPVESPVDAPKGKGDMPGKVIETTESVKSSVETVAQEKSEDEKPKSKSKAIVEDESKKEEDKPKALEVETPDEIPADEPKAVEEDTPEDPMKEILNTLNKLVGRISAIEEGMETSNSKLSNLDSFEQVATEAIEALAKSSVSNFQPKAKVNAIAEPGTNKSIFGRALAAKRAAAQKS